MITTIKNWSITILILSSLLISIPSVHAIPTKSLEPKVEITESNYKKMRQAQRKFKRAERQKKRIGRGLRVLLMVILVTISMVLFMLVIILAIGSVILEGSSQGGAAITIPLFLCILLLALSIWGIIRLVKSNRSKEKPKEKRSL